MTVKELIQVLKSVTDKSLEVHLDIRESGGGTVRVARLTDVGFDWPGGNFHLIAKV